MQTKVYTGPDSGAFSLKEEGDDRRMKGLILLSMKRSIKDPGSRIEDALKIISLRRKLAKIEEKKKKYPCTLEGRTQFIRDSLKTDQRFSWDKFSRKEILICVVLFVIAIICFVLGVKLI